ncbi:MAG TPA: GLPGLI family protein [Flavobacterium sp.]|jgi:GLPGLI family protein
MTRLFFKIAIAALTLLSHALHSQQFFGQAVYASKTKMLSVTGEGVNPEMAKRIEALAKKQAEKTFVLTFNQFESGYEEQQKLDTPGQDQQGVSIKVLNSQDGKRYTNIKANEAISEREIFGKEFLVTEPLRQWEWKLEPETKKIGEYMCNKATALIKVTEEEKIAFEKRKANMDKNPKRIIMIDEPKDQSITVWYAPEIPVSHGPANFGGLPGLVLEANDGRTVLLCTKIVLNPKEKPQINRPKNGEKITIKEFELLLEKKTKELLEINQSREQGDGVRIRIGG